MTCWRRLWRSLVFRMLNYIDALQGIFPARDCRPPAVGLVLTQAAGGPVGGRAINISL